MEDLTDVANALERAEEFKLTAEVVLWALRAMQRDNGLSIQQALSEGLTEWDC